MFDIDWPRVVELLDYVMDTLPEFIHPTDKVLRTKDDILSELKKYRDSNAVSVQFFIPCPTRNIPDLSFRVDPRRRAVLLVSAIDPSLKNSINRLLRVL